MSVAASPGPSRTGPGGEHTNSGGARIHVEADSTGYIYRGDFDERSVGGRRSRFGYGSDRWCRVLTVDQLGSAVGAGASGMEHPGDLGEVKRRRYAVRHEPRGRRRRANVGCRTTEDPGHIGSGGQAPLARPVIRPTKPCRASGCSSHRLAAVEHIAAGSIARAHKCDTR